MLSIVTGESHLRRGTQEFRYTQEYDKYVAVKPFVSEIWENAREDALPKVTRKANVYHMLASRCRGDLIE